MICSYPRSGSLMLATWLGMDKTHGHEPHKIYLYRNVVDVMISFYYYKEYKRGIEDFCEDMLYGLDWRKHIDFGLSCNSLKVKYENTNLSVDTAIPNIIGNNCIYRRDGSFGQWRKHMKRPLFDKLVSENSSYLKKLGYSLTF